jgi:hypothetical protein
MVLGSHQHSRKTRCRLEHYTAGQLFDQEFWVSG